jgi:HPt (histidine-containing phosphotransfer) domain-containing protein
MLNKDRIEEIRSLDEDGSDAVLKELIQVFQQATPGRLKKIHEAFDSKQYSLLRKEAHALRSGASAVGAEKLSAIAAAIEHAKNDSEEEFKNYIRQIDSEFESVSSELSTYL